LIDSSSPFIELRLYRAECRLTIGERELIADVAFRDVDHTFIGEPERSAQSFDGLVKCSFADTGGVQRLARCTAS
jgi:hypothetical protein